MPNIEIVGYPKLDGIEIEALIWKQLSKSRSQTKTNLWNETVTTRRKAVARDCNKHPTPFLRVFGTSKDELREVEKVLRMLRCPLDVDFVLLYKSVTMKC